MKKPSPFKPGVVFLLFLFGIGVFFFYRSMVDFTNNSYKVKVFPLGTSACLIMLCSAEFVVNHLMKKKSGQADNPEKIEEKRRAIIKLAKSAVWLMALPFGIWLVGFYITLPLFSFAYLRFNKIKLPVSIAVAVSVFLIIYFGFGIALRVRLYNGILLRGLL